MCWRICNEDIRNKKKLKRKDNVEQFDRNVSVPVLLVNYCPGWVNHPEGVATKLLLNCRYVCNFLLERATRHPLDCSVTKFQARCICNQLLAVSAICCQNFKSMSILQHCPSNFVAEPAHGYRSNIPITLLLRANLPQSACSCLNKRLSHFC